MLKLKLQYFGHLMRRADSLEKTVLLGKIEGGKSTSRFSMDSFPETEGRKSCPPLTPTLHLSHRLKGGVARVKV